MRISDIIAHNKIQPIQVGYAEPIWQVMQKMRGANVGIALVVKNDKICGFFSERIHFDAQVAEVHLDSDTPVGKLMKTSLFYSLADQNAEECIDFMKANHLRNIPVLENGKIVAVISRDMLYRKIIDNKNEEIEQLRTYITGMPSNLDLVGCIMRTSKFNKINNNDLCTDSSGN